MKHAPKGPVFARLDSLACSEAAKALVEEVCAEAIDWESRHGKLRKKRSAKDTISLRKTIEKLIGDILRANSLNREGIFRARRPEAFTGSGVGYRSFTAAVDALVGLGLITVTPGKTPRYRVYFEGVSQNLGGGRAAVFAVTSGLLKRAAGLGVSGDIGRHFTRELPKHPLELKRRSKRQGSRKERGQPKQISPTDLVAQQLRQQVHEINVFLAGFTIEGANHFGFVRKFHCGDDDDFSWNKGGRLYSQGEDNYQRMPATRKGDRQGRDEITIEREPVVEIDIRSCNLTIFYALIGEPLDLSEDPFGNLGIDRDLAKEWTNDCFGEGKLKDRWPAGFVAEYKKDHGHKPKLTARAVGAKVLAKLPHLKRLDDAEAPEWCDLQYLESESIITTMEALKQQGIPSLPVHDSLIVPSRHAKIASACLAESFLKVVGVRPFVTAKG